MIVFIKVLITILIFFNVYVLFNKINRILNKNIYEARLEDSNIKFKKKLNLVEINVLKKEKIFKMLEKKKDKIKKQGNPLNLNITTFYLFKIVPTVLVIFMVIMSRAFNLASIILIILIYNFIDLIYFFSNDDDKKKIKEDLPNIYDILDIQTVAGINLGIALTQVFDIPKSKRFCKDLMELSAEINLTKNIESALDNFIQKYDLVELDSFVLAIKQSIKSGRNRELLANQSEILKENNLLNISEKTKDVDKWVLVVGILVFLGIAAILALSFAVQVSNSFTNIF